MTKKKSELPEMPSFMIKEYSNPIPYGILTGVIVTICLGAFISGALCLVFFLLWRAKLIDKYSNPPTEEQINQFYGSMGITTAVIFVILAIALV